MPFFKKKNWQEGVAIEIAEAVVGALKGELSATAVNAPMVPAEVRNFSPFSIKLEISYILPTVTAVNECSYNSNQ